MRSSGAFADISVPMYDVSRTRRLATWRSANNCCPQFRRYLYNLNKGLSTIQFQSLSVAPDNPKHVQGGNQDNGTFETYGSSVVWPQIMYGDGGQSGFDVTNSTHAV